MDNLVIIATIIEPCDQQVRKYVIFLPRDYHQDLLLVVLVTGGNPFPRHKITFQLVSGAEAAAAGETMVMRTSGGLLAVSMSVSSSLVSLDSCQYLCHVTARASFRPDIVITGYSDSINW